MLPNYDCQSVRSQLRGSNTFVIRGIERSPVTLELHEVSSHTRAQARLSIIKLHGITGSDELKITPEVFTISGDRVLDL